MTIEEFDNFKFHAGMVVKYQERLYAVASVDFEERLMGLDDPEIQDVRWKRCENCTLHNS